MSAPGFILYPGDYARDTAHLTTEEHGAYFLLLMHVYSQGGRVPLNMRALANVAKMTKTRFANMWEETLSAFFNVDGDLIGHGRVDRELEKLKRISAARSAASKQKGAKKRLKSEAKFRKNESDRESVSAEKTEENQQKAAAIDQQLHVTKPTGLVSVSIETEKPNLTRDGEAALARLLDAAARAPSCSAAEIRRFCEDVKGFHDGALIVGGRYALDRYSQSLRQPLRQTGLRLAMGADVLPLAKAG